MKIAAGPGIASRVQLSMSPIPHEPQTRSRVRLTWAFGGVFEGSPQREQNRIGRAPSLSGAVHCLSMRIKAAIGNGEIVREPAVVDQITNRHDSATVSR
jgi:hypothetical protein